MKNKKNKINPKDLSTDQQTTWCPGCGNFFILESVKRAVSDLINETNLEKKDFSIVTGIGCHGKIFDYLDLNGFYGLHGRVLPVALGIKLSNPNAKVIGFGGDGDTYSEGMAHFIHAFRYNADITLVVHDNQSFSLTTGQATPTSQRGFRTNVNPYGEFNEPFNPIKIALSAGGSFIARCSSSDIEHTKSVLKQAILHKGFSYVEMMQKCVTFNPDINDIDKMMYKIPANSDYKKAIKLAEEWNYDSKKGKIPIGIIYKTKKPCLAEKWNKSRKSI